MKIVWDEPRRLANLDKHGLDFADLDELFFADDSWSRLADPGDGWVLA